MVARTGAPSKLLALAQGDSSAITSEMVAQAFRDGDELAKEVLRETADLLTIWLGNVVDLLEPDIVVVGGGVGEVVAQWFPHILANLPRWSLNQRCAETPLRLARYGSDAGIAGAAALCLARQRATAS